MVILSKACKPDNFESHNSLNLSFTNIQSLRSNFFDCESFFESNSPDILALCEPNLNDSIDSGNFTLRCYLPLIQKDLHGIYLQKTLQMLTYVFDWSYFTQCLTSFSSIDPLNLCAWFLILFYLIQMMFSQTTHLLIYLFVETLTSIIRTGLPVLLEVIDLVNSVIIFLSQMTLLKWLTFLLGSQTVILTVLLFWIDSF